MGQENTVPRRINKVEGALGEKILSGGPGVCESWSREGGLYGINVETLAGDKTLTPGTDKIYQYLDEGGANRIITLATAGAQAGDRFVIRHNGAYDDTHTLTVNQAATLLDWIFSGAIKEFIFDGTNWISRGIGTGEDDNKKYNLAIGYEANARFMGTAIGAEAVGRSAGVAIGRGAEGYEFGVAVGSNASGINSSVAIGYYASTNSKYMSIALGRQSKCYRDGETSININSNDTDQENNVVQGRFERTTTDATPVEIFLRGQLNVRFTIRPSSALAFKMTIVARDNVNNHVAMYTVEDGLVRMAGAGTAVMANCAVTVIFEDDAAWDVAVAIDGGGNNLIITVTGDADNPVQWAAVLDGIETHF